MEGRRDVCPMGVSVGFGCDACGGVDHAGHRAAGVRVQGRGRVAPFAQVLYGSAPLDDIAIQPGAGVDFRVSRHTAIRGAFDFKISGDDGSTYTGSRVSVGMVVLVRGPGD